LKKSTTITIVIIVLIGAIGAYKFYDMTLGRYWTTETTLEESLGSESKLLRIDIDEEAEFPHSIDLIYNGQIDGMATISYGWSDTAMYRTDTINGEFNLTLGGDWYSETCYILYTPITSKKGDLKVDSKIYSSRKK